MGAVEDERDRCGAHAARLGVFVGGLSDRDRGLVEGVAQPLAEDARRVLELEVPDQPRFFGVLLAEEQLVDRVDGHA